MAMDKGLGTSLAGSGFDSSGLVVHSQMGDKYLKRVALWASELLPKRCEVHFVHSCTVLFEAEFARMHVRGTCHHAANWIQ